MKINVEVRVEVKRVIDNHIPNTDPCSMELLQAHLHVALLIHVRGVGKQAVGGFNATLL